MFWVELLAMESIRVQDTSPRVGARMVRLARIGMQAGVGKVATTAATVMHDNRVDREVQLTPCTVRRVGKLREVILPPRTGNMYGRGSTCGAGGFEEYCSREHPRGPYGRTGGKS